MDWLALDLKVFRAIHLGWHSAPLDVYFLIFSYLGLGQVQFLLAFLTQLPAYKKRIAGIENWLLSLLVVILFSGLPAVHLMKSWVSRLRPSNLPDALPQEAHLRGSFPSGHTTTSFAVAFVLLMLTWGSRRAWLGYVALFLASQVGLSRIYRGVHWPSDVVAGIFLGLGCAVLVRSLAIRLDRWPVDPSGQAENVTTATPSEVS